MSYLGRFQLGADVPLFLRCRDASLTPTQPDAPPQAKVFSGTTVVEARLMPVCDQKYVAGQFRLPLRLTRIYSVGRYQVVYYYAKGSFHGLHTDDFEIVPGGDARGAISSAYFLERPEASYVVQGTEEGAILVGRNPAV